MASWVVCSVLVVGYAAWIGRRSRPTSRFQREKSVTRMQVNGTNKVSMMAFLVG